jgi:hypothetical protein
MRSYLQRLVVMVRVACQPLIPGSRCGRGRAYDGGFLPGINMV